MEPRVSFTLVAFSVILTSYVYAVDAIEVIRSTNSSDLFTNPDVNATKESASKTCRNYNSIDVGGQCERDDCMICRCEFDRPTFLAYRQKCCNIKDLITGLPSDHASFKGKWITVTHSRDNTTVPSVDRERAFLSVSALGPPFWYPPNMRPLNVSFGSVPIHFKGFDSKFGLVLNLIRLLL